MYHVLEHISEPDKKLLHYKSLLAENGRLMVSTPEWLWELEESGFGVVSSFKNVYHKDHIDVFTRQSIKNLFSKCGLIVEKEDHITYGQTYLLRPATAAEMAELKIVPEKWEEQLEKIMHTKRAIELLKQDKFRDALNEYPLFPDAYFRWCLDSPLKKDIARCEEVLREGLAAMPDNVKIHQTLANFLYQQERYAEALEQFDWLIKHKLAEDYLVFKAWSLYHLGKLPEAMNAFNAAATMNPMKYAEAMTWICKCATEMKTWDERAIDQLTEQMVSSGKAKPVLVDPVFDENGKAEEKTITVPA
jgi:tetratricopeptide (TPR) repeat protein